MIWRWPTATRCSNPVKPYRSAVPRDHVRIVGDSFRVAIQLSALFIVISLLFYVGLGLLARLMPQLQIFFVALPIRC